MLSDPSAWVALLTLSALEIVLGIDNIIFLSILVGRLPASQQRSARFLGLGFAMVTRLALLFSISWLTTLRAPLFEIFGQGISGRDLILFASARGGDVAGTAFWNYGQGDPNTGTIRPGYWIA